MADLPRECRAEPKLAFDGGADGLDIVRRILDEAGRHLTPQGGLLCEIGRGRERWRPPFRNCRCSGSIPRIPRAKCSGSPPPICEPAKCRAAGPETARLSGNSALHRRSRPATKLIACAAAATPPKLEEAPMLDKSPRPAAVNVPNDLAAHWMPFTANRAFKKSAAAARRRQGHALLHRRRPQDHRRRRRHVVQQCRPRPHPDFRGDRQAGRDAGLRAAVPVRHSAGLRARQPHRRSGAGRPRPRVLLQFRIGSRRYRAEDRAGLSPDPAARAPAPA